MAGYYEFQRYILEWPVPNVTLLDAGLFFDTFRTYNDVCLFLFSNMDVQRLVYALLYYY